jgi:outer membrane protein W
MRKTLIGVGWTAALVLAAAQAPVSAQVTFEAQLTPLVTSTISIGDHSRDFAIMRQAAIPLIVQGGEFRDGTGGGVAAGIRIVENVGIEGMFFWVPTQLQARAGLESYGGSVDVNSIMWGATALYYFPWLGTVEPFLGVGVGAETTSYDPQLAWERNDDLMGIVAVGGSAWLTDRVALRLEARDCLTRFDPHITGIERSTESHLMMSAGLTFRAGPRR